MLTREELSRYNRHLILKEFGLEGQEKLKAAKVLVVGTGGLGSPSLLYLTAAGVGTIGLLDFDVVDESNLQRQVLFEVNDVGRPKVEAARDRLQALNPHVQFILHHTTMTSKNALDIIKNYDIVSDGSDNFQTRYLVNDACVMLDKPLIYGSIFQFEGQVSVFNHRDKNQNPGPNYRDLFATPPPPGLVPSCSEAGVLGVLPGIIGAMQANEAIKIITGIGEPLSGRLFLWNALTFESRIIKFHRDESNPLNGKNPTIKELIDYDEFCGIVKYSDDAKKEITVKELKKMIDEKQNVQLVDVREPFESDICNLGGDLIPLRSVAANIHRIAKDRPVVVYCKTGARSAKAIERLEQLGFSNLMNLRGGIMAYASEVDPSLQKY